ncbi:hypothetical protein V1264_018456 [Littorina saxatilis]|uniref:Transposase IS30-like HTH domain-containing protein n=1 Tax=Littorina saxatilis TaxID=31220 RepID=A0AAN9BDS1_9CAEN
MVGRQKLSLLDRGRAIGWFQDGVGVREIARRLLVTPSVITRLRQRFQATGLVQDRPRQTKEDHSKRRSFHHKTGPDSANFHCKPYQKAITGCYQHQRQHTDCSQPPACCPVPRPSSIQAPQADPRPQESSQSLVQASHWLDTSAVGCGLLH